MGWDDRTLESEDLGQTALEHPMATVDLRMLACLEPPFRWEESMLNIDLVIEY